MDTNLSEGFVPGFLTGFGAAIIFMVLAGFLFLALRPWIRLKLSGGRSSLLTIIAMKLRGTPPDLVINAYVSLLHRGASITLAEVESQYVANRGDIVDWQDLLKIAREHERRKGVANQSKKS